MSLRGRSTLGLAVWLLGCDPIYSVSGQVRSVPRGMPVTAAEPLPNAQVVHVCGDWRNVLDTTNSDGNFVGGGFGAFVLENEPATIATGAVGLSLILPGAGLAEAGRARGEIKLSP